MHIYRRFGKRLFDAVLAVIGLVIFSVPMGIIALLTAIELRASPIFRQRRIGYGGKEFTIVKFRTMTDNGEVRAWGRRFRSTAMDELPQLIHILKGEMSFVGPRPLIPEELQQISRFQGGNRRFLARPGLTGLAQVNSAKTPELSERLKWDLAYVDHSSFSIDISIIVKSVFVTLGGSWERTGHGPA